MEKGDLNVDHLSCETKKFPSPGASMKEVGIRRNTPGIRKARKNTTGNRHGVRRVATVEKGDSANEQKACCYRMKP
jgi:hypothetical protein